MVRSSGNHTWARRLGRDDEVVLCVLALDMEQGQNMSSSRDIRLSYSGFSSQVGLSGRYEQNPRVLHIHCPLLLQSCRRRRKMLYMEVHCFTASPRPACYTLALSQYRLIFGLCNMCGNQTLSGCCMLCEFLRSKQASPMKMVLDPSST